MSEKYYSVSEVMQILSIKSNRTIYRYIKTGKLKAIKFNDRIRISEADLQEFISENFKKVENNE